MKIAKQASVLALASCLLGFTAHADGPEFAEFLALGKYKGKTSTGETCRVKIRKPEAERGDEECSPVYRDCVVIHYRGKVSEHSHLGRLDVETDSVSDEYLFAIRGDFFKNRSPNELSVSDSCFYKNHETAIDVDIQLERRQSNDIEKHDFKISRAWDGFRTGSKGTQTADCLDMKRVD